MRFFNRKKDEALKEVLRFYRNFVVFDEFAKYLLYKIEEKTALDDRTRSELLKIFRKFYEKEKKDALKSFDAEYSFRQSDEQAIAFVDSLNDYYLGRFFQADSRVKKEVLSWMSKYYLKNGNPIGKGQKGIAEFLDKFGGYLSEKSELKARQIIDTTMNTMRNFARINSFIEAGVERFRWDATNDRLTCPACRSMDGRIIETKAAKEQIDLVINSKPEDLPNIRPIATNYYKGKTSNFPLKTPPMHPLCRCTVAAEFESTPVKYKVGRPADAPITSEQLELEEMFNNLSNDEIHNKVKAHLGDVWARPPVKPKDKHIKNFLDNHIQKKGSFHFLMGNSHNTKSPSNSC
ncbi:phage minor head protein [Hippea sp. KM1]|uniref:phage minor head protein n=1 Tax=Hippea sp. KM1 TaxID=944481 RepID=UPI00046CE211|nr:phage minor head protein [Hippea sp. KM1]